MTEATQFFRNRSSGFYTVVAIVMVALIGFIDFKTPPPLNLVLLYLLPILFAELCVGPEVGVFMTLFSTMAWAVGSDSLFGGTSNLAIHSLNILTTFVILVSVNGVMALMRAAGLRETAASRTDRLSGLLNRMGFTDAIHREMARSRRHKRAFSLVYFNADQFKAVNTDLGHPTGDHVIEIIGRALLSGMRSSDIVARLEGDEFMALLPEMDAEATRMALTRVHQLLNEAMHNRNWKITFRAGSLTFLKPPESSESLLQLAERLQFVIRAVPKNTLKALPPVTSE